MMIQMTFLQYKWWINMNNVVVPVVSARVVICTSMLHHEIFMQNLYKILYGPSYMVYFDAKFSLEWKIKQNL